jgi:hypothetical protein
MSKATHTITTSSSRFALAAAFALPCLALTLGTLLNTAGPATALASNAPEHADHGPITTLPARTQDPLITDRTRWLSELETIPNPLYYPPPVEAIVQVEQGEPQPRPVDVSAPAPFVVTAMLRGRDGSARAVIDGMLFDAGDELAPGWVIIEINPTRRHVSLRKPDGTTLLLPMQTAGN